ncbi:MAG TPA: hypothetical protein VF469_16715 [Kofleriaceae bacterium]
MGLPLLALLTPPLAVLLAGRRLSDGARLALVVTVVVTWCVAVALGLLLGGVDDIATILMLFFVVLPMIGSLVAAGVAAWLVHGRGLFVSAFALALVGWYAGLTIMILLEPSRRALREPALFWVVLNAFPVVYASSAAVLGAGLAGRRVG